MENESSDCPLKGKEYSDGSRVCGDDGCWVCDKGKWLGIREFNSVAKED